MQNVTVRRCDGIRQSDDEDESYDCVYSYAVLSHVDYSVAAVALSELVRVLRLGGTLLNQIYIGSYEKIAVDLLRDMAAMCLATTASRSNE